MTPRSLLRHRPDGRKSLRPALTLATAVVCLLATAFGSAQAQAPGKTLTLDEALRAVRAERQSVSQENREREARFLQDRNQQRAELERIKGEVRAAEGLASKLEGDRNKNALELDELKQQLAERQGEFGELFGAARAAAGDLNEQLQESLVSAQFPGRGEDLVSIAQSETLPSIGQLEGLWFTLMQEAVEQAKVVSFDTTVVGVDNQPAPTTVTRIGPFIAFSDGEFLRFENDALKRLPRQPGGAVNAAAKRVEQHSGPGYVAGVIDPSLGALLGLVVDIPNLREQVKQGGGIGYAIMVVAALGILYALYRWVRLALISAAVSSQMRSKTPSPRNPLGRVMLAYSENRDADIETVQLKLDDAVLKEVPPLERGLGLIKVLAAVTPLMGLLGTVIGMINTFQAITLFGTGDPKLMAGGISQALVTTVQGLVAAIPLLLLHTFAAGSARRVTQVLEEQAAGLVAEYSEAQPAESPRVTA